MPIARSLQTELENFFALMRRLLPVPGSDPDFDLPTQSYVGGLPVVFPVLPQ